jgi:Rrf2 family protein
MKITYKGDYALKTILDLSLNYGEEPVTIQEIAKRSDIPVKFLEQILLELKRGCFVESRRGKIGGYLLAKHPSKIRLGEVIRYIDGAIEPIGCVDKHYKGCRDINKCVFRDVWVKVTESTSKIIDNITFEDLAKKAKSLDKALVYQI